MNSPFVCVLGNDRVIRYTGVNITSGGLVMLRVGEGLAWEVLLTIFDYFVNI